MADEADKTEEPSPRRLEEARRRGQVARSRELSGALVTAAVLGSLAATAPGWLGALVLLVRTGVTHAVSTVPAAPQGRAIAALSASGLLAARALALPLGAAVIAALLVGALQTRGLLVFEPLLPKVERLAPDPKRLWGAQNLAELIKGLLLIGLVGGVAYTVLRGQAALVVRLVGARPEALLAALGRTLQGLGFAILGVMIGVGGADYLWQRHRMLRSLRMSRDELKREHKESEGDPEHKAERQRLHRELSQQRALEEVRRADLVVVNPDHIAVALRYDRDGQGAPVVIAQGTNLMAARIREIAREAGVPIFRDVTLARSLAEVPEGDEIPEALYQAVAELLRIVYGMQAPAPGPGAADGRAEQPAAPGPAAAGWTRV